MVDIAVAPTDGQYLPSTVQFIAFKTAARLTRCWRPPKCGQSLLEPIYAVDISEA